MTNKKLAANQQCKTCPFKKSSTVSEIPGYCPKQHEDLREITLEEGHETNYSKLSEPAKVMACHHRHDKMCIGWANHQLGVGNVRLRLSFSLGKHDDIEFPLKLDGTQVDTFDQTFK